MDLSFSNEFNYNTWTPNTELLLCNVDWDNTGAIGVDFYSKAQMDAYLQGTANARTILHSQKAKLNEPIRLDVLFNDIIGYNYIRATNNIQSAILGDRKISFYYFILGAREVATHTTEIEVQLDVFHTFKQDITLGRCFVEQGHLGIAATNSFQNRGRDFLTIPEGLDTGSDYVIRRTSSNRIITSSDFSVMIGSTIDLQANPGTDAKPLYPPAKGGTVQGLPSGASYYIFDSATDFETYWKTLEKVPWIAAGIFSITAIPNMNLYVQGWRNTQPLSNWQNIRIPGNPRKPPATKIEPRVNSTGDGSMDWREYFNQASFDIIPERYRSLRKLWTYPFMVVEMTTNEGQPLILKPENWDTDSMTYRTFLSILPPGQRITAMPAGYNRENAGTFDAYHDDGGEFLDMTTNITGFPSFAVVNNSGAIALASQQGSIGYSYHANAWSQQRTNEASKVMFDQAGMAINMNTGRNTLENMNLNANRAIDADAATKSAVGGAFESVLNLQLGSALFGGAQTMISENAANSKNALQIAMNNSGTKLSNTEAQYVRNTNKGLSDFGSQGDYNMGIKAIQAKLQDAQFVQPSMGGQMGGNIQALANFFIGVTMKIKTVDDGAIRRVGEYWLRYGYSLHQYWNIGKRFSVMDKFTYWKLADVNVINTTIPESFKRIIAGQFQRGITIYKEPSDIGTVDPATNKPLQGVTL